MISVFDESAWRKFVRGYTIYDCAILREQGCAFILVEEKDNRDVYPRTRFLHMALERPLDNRFGMCESGSFTFATIASSLDPGGYVAVDTASCVYSVSALQMGEEKPIDEVIDMSTYGGRTGIVKKVVRAAGQVYALGDYRKIYRPIGLDAWIELGKEGCGVPLPQAAVAGSSLGFSDMSAFASGDMYAVGGEGDVWRFDGATWHDCAFPTTADLKTVCCGGDGVVYITEINGSVWAGRGTTWACVAEADIAAGFQPVDAAWFNNRLYLGGMEGLWALDREEKRLVPLQDVEADAPNATNGGRLDVSPDGRFLLTAGPFGACLHDGNGWRRLFSAFDFL